jgi:hypothetical protein
LRTALFAYGSLVDPASAAITLGRPVELAGIARLEGWRRAWTQGRRNLLVEKTFAREDGSIPEWCLGLNVEPDAHPGAAPNGALIEVDEDDLERLDVRELRYARADVSGALGDAGFDRVLTYVARPEHHVARAPRDAIVIASYLRTVERAFARLGPEELVRFRTTTPTPPAAVEEAVLVQDRIPPGNPREW